jgi:hypothetical protein
VCAQAQWGDTPRTSSMGTNVRKSICANCTKLLNNALDTAAPTGWVSSTPSSRHTAHRMRTTRPCQWLTKTLCKCSRLAAHAWRSGREHLRRTWQRDARAEADEPDEGRAQKMRQQRRDAQRHEGEHEATHGLRDGRGGAGSEHQQR